MTMSRQRTPIQLKHSDVPELRDQLYKRQKGICPICKKLIVGPCLDHHHVKRVKGTGLIRGVLCRTCNVFIAKSENNCVRYGIGADNLPAILRNMADYLEKTPYPYIHPSEAPKAQKLKKSSYNILSKAVLISGKRMPGYPKTGKLTVELQRLFLQFNLIPEFYK